MPRFNSALVTILLSLGLVGLLVYLLQRDRDPKPAADTLIVYCAPALKVPVEKLAQEFEAEAKQKVEIRYGPSQAILAQAILNREKPGDLFLPADESYVLEAQKKNLIDETISVAKMKVVALVHSSWKTPINSFQDLLNPKLRLTVVDPDAGAIGKIIRDHLEKSGQWDVLKKNIKTSSPTVVEAANSAKLGSVDVALAWDSMAKQYPDLKIVRLPEFDPMVGRVQIGVLKSTKHPTDALRLARFLTSRDRGQPVFQHSGFVDIEAGDIYKPKPVISLFSGAMLRPAIEKTLKEFTDREGVEINTTYNGCGILVAQMEAGAQPDLYFSCDTMFMKKVHEKFGPPTIFSNNQLVIAVPKGNPLGIKELKDLGKQEMRIGVGHEKECALGQISRDAFIRRGVYAQLRKNVKVESPTGDFLINQLRSGALDVVVAYRSNVKPFDDIEGIIVEGADCQPEQPLAIGKDSDNPQLSDRLFKTLSSEKSKKRFEEWGFTWELK